MIVIMLGVLAIGFSAGYMSAGIQSLSIHTYARNNEKEIRESIALFVEQSGQQEIANRIREGAVTKWVT